MSLPAFANGALLALVAITLYALARWAWGPPVWLPGGEAGGRLAQDAHDFAVSALAIGFTVGAVRYTFEANGRDVATLSKRGVLASRCPRLRCGGRTRWRAPAGPGSRERSQA